MPSDILRKKVELLRSVGLWHEEYKEHYTGDEMWKLFEAQLKYLRLNSMQSTKASGSTV